MAQAGPAASEEPSKWAEAYAAVEDRVEHASAGVAEFLLPSGTLKVTSHSERILNHGRWLVFFVYLALTAIFFYLVFWVFFSGRIEVWNSLYKVDRIETPSVAICPYEAGATLRPVSIVSDPAVHVTFFTGGKALSLPVTPRSCHFDRECVCVDLFDPKVKDPVEPLRSPQFRDHGVDPEFLGPQDSAESQLVAQDRIEVRTTLLDHSPERTLKFGFYDSQDRAPHWVYSHVGSSVVGQLLLDNWFVISLTGQALKQFCTGDWTAMSRQRHIFRYFSQEIRHDPGTEAESGARDPRETRLSYEMQTFFVHWIYASETALSLYSLILFLLLLALRGPIVHAFFDAAFPVVKVQEEPRKMHWVAERIMHYLCCDCCPCKRDEDEQQPLLSAPERDRKSVV